MTIERCVFCDCETGNAGKGDDSLFLPDDTGPYCTNHYKSEILKFYTVKIELGIGDTKGNFLGYGEGYIREFNVKSIWEFKEQVQLFVHGLQPGLKKMIENDYINDRGEYGDARIVEVSIDGDLIEKDEDREYCGVEELESVLTFLNF